MLIETATALYNHLNSINEDRKVIRSCDGEVTVLMSEKYREIIALNEKDQSSKIKYPIIVIYDDAIQYDVARFYNNQREGQPFDAEYEGKTVKRVNFYEPNMPYNLNYRIEIITKQRIQLDSILLWVMQNVPDRGCLDVPYVDADDEKTYIYRSLLKRGPITKADEQTSSVLYRRVFELRLTTLIDGQYLKTVTVKDTVNVEEKGEDSNG